MIKFKKQNILQISKNFNISYYKLDVLRQTTIERLVIQANKENYTKEQIKNYILKNVDYLLDIMIQEN